MCRDTKNWLRCHGSVVKPRLWVDGVRKIWARTECVTTDISVSVFTCNHDLSLRESYPLVNVYVTMENHHAINGKIHYKWKFSIAILVYQRLPGLINELITSASQWGLIGNMDDQPVEIHQKCFSFTMKKMGIQCIQKPRLSPAKCHGRWPPLTYKHGGFSAPKSYRPHWNILKPLLLGRKKDPGSDPPRFASNFSDRGKHQSVKTWLKAWKNCNKIHVPLVVPFSSIFSG